jgi:hypothetical protein
MPKNIPQEVPSENRIYMVRNTRVMIDEDLAKLYNVPTKVLVQAVKRNLERFPGDFMYHLTNKEVIDLRSQFVTSNREGRGGRRSLPYAFTEQGVAMISSVLRSKQAVQVNIQIMRVFVRARELATAHTDLWLKIDALQKKYDGQFQVVFRAIKTLLEKHNEGPEKRF